MGHIGGSSGGTAEPASEVTPPPHNGKTWIHRGVVHILIMYCIITPKNNMGYLESQKNQVAKNTMNIAISNISKRGLMTPTFL